MLDDDELHDHPSSHPKASPILTSSIQSQTLDIPQLAKMPSVTIPPSTQTVNVQIFDTTFRILGGRPQAFMSPLIKGFERMNALAYSFLITHKDSNGKERKFLFDLGAPKNWKEDLPPSIADHVKKWEKAGIVIECEKYLTELLRDHGVVLEEIEGMIWR